MELLPSLGALLQVIVIDLVLAGDNAVVIGLAAAGLPPRLRRKAIILGIVAATLLRIGFALFAVQILAITGLLIAGGILLLWVCWKMWLELRAGDKDEPDERVASGQPAQPKARKTLGQAVQQIVLADVSMSLDNVLAVAGAAHKHPSALVFGLVLSVVLMGFASAFVARVLNRFPWIGYLGLVIILFVALRMIYHGADEVLPGTFPSFGPL